jgi:hypothetical protein
MEATDPQSKIKNTCPPSELDVDDLEMVCAGSTMGKSFLLEGIRAVAKFADRNPTAAMQAQVVATDLVRVGAHEDPGFFKAVGHVYRALRDLAQHSP